MNARAPSGASSTAASAATTSAAFTSARATSWAPVKTSNDGAAAVTALATQMPPRHSSIIRRRPQRSARAAATSETSTPTRMSASAKPSAWFDLSNESITASPLWVSSDPPKFASSPTAASAATARRLLGRERDRRHQAGPRRGRRDLVAGDRGLEPRRGRADRTTRGDPEEQADEPPEVRDAQVRIAPRAARRCRTARVRRAPGARDRGRPPRTGARSARRRPRGRRRGPGTPPP